MRWIAALATCFAAYSGLFGFLYYGPFVGVIRAKTFPMTWQMGEPLHQGNTQAHVVLNFRDYPGHHIGIFSDDLARYLRGLGSDTLDVTFEVTTD